MRHQEYSKQRTDKEPLYQRKPYGRHRHRSSFSFCGSHLITWTMEEFVELKATGGRTLSPGQQRGLSR